MDLPNSIIRSDGSVDFNNLYKRTRTGAIEEWHIRVEEKVGDEGGGYIITTHGHVDGKKQENRDLVTEGKNTGKKNQTNPLQQAVAEAAAKWDKQKKKGYVEGITAAAAGQVDTDVIKGGLSPMLAAKFAEDGDKVQWPAYLQPKLDGHRCIAVIDNGKATLWSRSRKLISSVPHINQALELAFAGKTLSLDGELYVHELRDNFQKLSGLLRRDESSEETRIAQYHVYDMPSAEDDSGETGPVDYHARYEWLKHIMFEAFQENNLPELILVDTIEVEDEDAAMLAFEYYLGLGYEGAMVRNRLGSYEAGHRSVNLQKMKKFSDAEWKIVGIQEGRGKMAGHAIFVCERILEPTPSGATKRITFNAKMKGPMEQLAEYFENPEKYIGRQLTVKYQGFYKSGAPRFPVAWRLKEEI